MSLARLITFALLLISVQLDAAQLTIPTGALPGGVMWSSNNVGVVGGVPNVTTIYTNLSPTGNALMDWTNIETALLLCPSNQVVYLNAGTYSISGSHSLSWGFIGSEGALPYSGNNSVVLRGAGMGKTILNLDYGSNFELSGFPGNYPDTTNMMYYWGSGYAQGATNITVSTNFHGALPSGLTNGDLIMLTQENDPALVNLFNSQEQPDHFFIDGWGQDCNQVQFVRVTSVSNGTNLTIWPGVYMTNYQASLRPQILWIGNHYVTTNCGLENLTINNNVSNLANAVIFLDYCYNCWVKGVEFNHPGYSAVTIRTSAHCSMVDCYVHDSASGGGATSYGGNAYICSDSLFQNNIFNRITSPALFIACSGCVFGYNFTTNLPYFDPTFLAAAFQTHGPHPFMNLFEGNVGASMSYDVLHGSSSHNITFRNYLYGLQPGTIYNNYPVQVAAENRDISIIGNVLGTDGYHTNYEFTCIEYPTNYANLYSIYYLGFMGGTVLNTNSDPVAVTTLWREGNFDYATHSTIWDGNGAVTLPSSLYLTSKPSWWGSAAWPSIGSDLTPMVGTIPAQLQFDAMGIPTAVLGGTGTGGGGTFGSWRTQ